MDTNAELQEGRKNDPLGFSVASVEIANGDCPEPLDRGLGTLLLPVMCSSWCQCGFGSDYSELSSLPDFSVSFPELPFQSNICCLQVQDR